MRRLHCSTRTNDSRGRKQYREDKINGSAYACALAADSAGLSESGQHAFRGFFDNRARRRQVEPEVSETAGAE